MRAKDNKKRFISMVTIGEKGQIVIPKEAREMFHIRPGDTLLILGEEEKGLIVSRPELLRELADQIFDSGRSED